MRNTNFALATLLVSTTAALAGEPPSPAPAPAPAAPAAEPAAPAPADPAAPVEAVPATPATPAPAPAPAPMLTDAKPTPGMVISSEPIDEAPSKPGRKDKKPRIALELSGTTGYNANPYVEYQGWTLKNGTPVGTRIEANLVGISLGYELTRMGNDQACGVGCYMGDFGSTTFHAVDLGYRVRFAKLGPVRPFVTMGLGGVYASSGNWGPETSKTVKGGQGRAGFGVEIPILDKFFASVTLAYRAIVTENPLRNPDMETSNKVFVGNDVPNGDYAEDAHIVSGYVGFGVSL